MARAALAESVVRLAGYHFYRCKLARLDEVLAALGGFDQVRFEIFAILIYLVVQQLSQVNMNALIIDFNDI